MMKKNFIKCPLNYIGGKTKILDQILPFFPEKISTFVEPFCGGYNVGINIKAKKYYAFDINTYLIELIDYLKQHDRDSILKSVDEVVSKYDLSLTNRDGYNKLRDDYNNAKNPLYLFVLTCYSFNHQIRYNNSFDFNTPFGKDRSCYNESIRFNLINFIDALHNQDVKFEVSDYKKVSSLDLDGESFVYCDPPYFITTGSYNDGKRGFGDWKEKDEIELLSLLDQLNTKGIKFALSNVMVHNGLKNSILEKWSSKYNVHFISTNYNNSNYHSKAKEHETLEVLITNY